MSVQFLHLSQSLLRGHHILAQQPYDKLAVFFPSFFLPPSLLPFLSLSLSFNVCFLYVWYKHVFAHICASTLLCVYVQSPEVACLLLVLSTLLFELRSLSDMQFTIFTEQID